MFSGMVKHAAKSSFGRGFKHGALGAVSFKHGGILGVGMTALSVYQGYRQGGLAGAVKEGATSVVQQAVFEGLFRSAGSVLMNPIAIGAAAVAGGSYGYYKLGEAGKAHMKRFRNLEMGSDVVDTFGTMATIRQRSLSAIQNSHINGRLALGGEAALLHTTMMR